MRAIGRLNILLAGTMAHKAGGFVGAEECCAGLKPAPTRALGNWVDSDSRGLRWFVERFAEDESLE
jgi:hypothetical protein